MIDRIEALVVQTEAEALLAEQNFIRQYKPRFNIRLRDDKSYPFIAISLDEDFPRVYFTRERHRRDRAYFGPFSSAKRTRATLEVLGKVFMFRTCEGPEPGRRSGSPCLDYYIKRCQAPCVGYISKEDYRSNIDGVIAFLSGRYREIERRLEHEMNLASAEQRYEDAARERNRLRAVRQLLERQRVANDGTGTLDAIAVAVGDSDANAQVLQVRDGVLSDRQSFYLDNAGEAELGEVAEAFILQYYAAAMLIPALVVVQHELPDPEALAAGAERATRGEGRGSRRRARRQAADPRARRAQRAARARSGEAAQRAAPPAAGRGARRSAGGARPRRDPAADRVLRHLDADGDQHGRLDGRVRRCRAEEVRLPAVQDPERRWGGDAGDWPAEPGPGTADGAGAPKGTRTGNGRSGDYGPDDFAAMEEVLGRRMAQFETQHDRSPHDKDYDPSFAALPNLIVIDGGKGQLSAGLRALQGFRDRGVTVISLAKRIEEVFIPGREEPLVLPHDTPELQLLQRRPGRGPPVCDHAPPAAARPGDDRVDPRRACPGVGPARKRALLTHFGSPDAVLAASREELEAVPGVSGKLARELAPRAAQDRSVMIRLLSLRVRHDRQAWRDHGAGRPQ